MGKKESHLDKQHNLIDLFDQYFSVIPADTEEKLEQCYRLRYEVYCKEGILPGNKMEDYPDGLERDEYDQHAVHFLLLHKLKNYPIGTVRIILADPKKPEKKFPLERVAGDLLISDLLPYKKIPRTHLGEISRLIIAPEFRVRKGEHLKPYGVSDDFENSFQHERRHRFGDSWQGPEHRKDNPRRIFPHTVVGLFVAIIRMSVEHNLNYWYGAMEPVCARFLRSFGIEFKPITPIFDYHGLRQGFIGHFPDILENIYRVNSQLWSLLMENISDVKQSE